MCIVNPKVITSQSIYQSKVYDNNPIMQVNWNAKNFSINQKKTEKEEEGD